MIEDIIVRPMSNLEGEFIQTFYHLFVEAGVDLIVIDENSGHFFNDCVDFGISEGILRYSGFLENKTFQNRTGLTYSLTNEGKKMFDFLEYKIN